MSMKSFLDKYNVNPGQFASKLMAGSWLTAMIIILPTVIGLLGSMVIAYGSVSAAGAALMSGGFLIAFGKFLLIAIAIAGIGVVLFQIFTRWDEIVTSIANGLWRIGNWFDSSIFNGLNNLRQAYNDFWTDIYDADNFSIAGGVLNTLQMTGVMPDSVFGMHMTLDINDPRGFVQGVSTDPKNQSEAAPSLTVNSVNNGDSLSSHETYTSEVPETLDWSFYTSGGQ